MFKTSVKIKNYKCFVDEAGYDEILRVNLLIGRNNSGKSALLDVIEIISKGAYDIDTANWRRNSRSEVVFSSTISEAETTKTFPRNVSSGRIHGNHGEYGEQFIGRAISWSISTKGVDQARLLTVDDVGIKPPLAETDDYPKRLANVMPIPLAGKIFKRISAERDIVAEASEPNRIDVRSNGAGITNAIQCFVNLSNLPSNLVEQDLLAALNEIFACDANFNDIVCQLHENGAWEIYLQEEHKGRIALSKSGSGLKTVITVLVHLILIPKIEKKSLSNYVFGFEELENNIHPALLRRLNGFLYRMAVENDFVYFLTTHSNVLIDQFSKQDDAQIIHVKHQDGESYSSTIQTYIDNNGVLDDLDVRASDLLQANGIIWVEGPSDRVYINRWIELWSEGRLKEGTHYQVIFYGGRLLAHLSANDPQSVEDGISILNANRNAIIVIDSDKRAKQTRLNSSKTRLINEFGGQGKLSWVTGGREIENYIPAQVVGKVLGLSVTKNPEQYECFFDYLDRLQKFEGKKYSKKKSLLAEKVVPFMTLDSMSTSLDLNDRMQEICAEIKKWNR
jgi:putative ATP-dependent endonuclease of OLD family